MKEVLRAGMFLIAGAVLASCSMFQSRKGPIAQESSRLHSEGKQLRADGEKTVSDGVDLQNKAKELRVVADEKRRQAGVLDSQGDASKASQLRLEADSQEADAAASETKGHDLEAQGRDMIQRADQTLNESETLQKRGQRIDRKKADTDRAG